MESRLNGQVQEFEDVESPNPGGPQTSIEAGHGHQEKESKLQEVRTREKQGTKEVPVGQVRDEQAASTKSKDKEVPGDQV